jgi:arylsulfatase
LGARFNPDLAGRRQLIKGSTQVLFGRMGRLTENSVLSLVSALTVPVA